MLMFEKGHVYHLWYCGIICCQVDVFSYGTEVLCLRMTYISLDICCYQQAKVNLASKEGHINIYIGMVRTILIWNC